MARYGEGDPRWIVEDRPDSVNVNNWHWREKSADVWSREFFSNHLKGKHFEKGEMEGEFTGLADLEGDSMVCNRKGKLIVIFDWNVTVSYTVMPDRKLKGRKDSSSFQKKGKIRVLEVCHDVSNWRNLRAEICDEDDFAVRKFVLSEGLSVLISIFKQYTQQLEAYARDLILPTLTDAEVLKSKNQITNTSTKT